MFESKAVNPTATLFEAVVLASNAAKPTPTLPLPVVNAFKESAPIPTLLKYLYLRFD